MPLFSPTDMCKTAVIKNFMFHKLQSLKHYLEMIFFFYRKGSLAIAFILSNIQKVLNIDRGGSVSNLDYKRNNILRFCFNSVF